MALKCLAPGMKLAVTQTRKTGAAVEADENQGAPGAGRWPEQAKTRLGGPTFRWLWLRLGSPAVR